MKRYFYNGPVTMFGALLADHWRGETEALTEKKARSNLIYQYKKQNGYAPSAKVELPGKLTLAG